MLIHDDPHLNLFWVYGSRIKNQNDSDITNVNYLENNITKALINTLESLSADSSRMGFLKDCGVLPQDAMDSSLEFEFHLQRKPDKHVVNSFTESNRFLWGISPTGDAWDIGRIPLEKLDFNNRKESIRFILEQIEDELKIGNNEEDFAQKEATRLFDEIEAIQNNKGESIPDGWIMIYKKINNNSEREPLYCIAIENKWHKLDPYQLVNHWKKSLYHSEGKASFSKYADIYKSISHYSDESPIVIHFLEYMSLIGEEPFIGFANNDFLELNDPNNQRLISKKFWKFFDGFITEYVKKHNSELRNSNLTVEYSKKNQRLYINGFEYINLYFDFWNSSGKLTISTEIGVNRAWVNRCLLPFLKANRNKVLQLASQYKDDYYSRHVRLNNKSKSVYFWIKNFDTLENYLNEVNTDKIAVPQLPKEACISELKNLNVPPDDDKLKSLSHWSWKTWHWLEYLRIIETIEINEYCGEDAVKQLNIDLTSSINRQCEGIRMLNELLSEAQK